MRRDHPEFQAGKLNGMGGKLEPGETLLDCMAREAVEEAGYFGDWESCRDDSGLRRS
ncbi:NUDIX domain-containing protein [uncultured Desulfovibrio sp.]|uniref:NUDIX domain-containing protein n=1 Tax=uncultured Desulfovibrio sp. TaxID=167968 RepID=UPI002622B8D6|nr:NUDIX domain-containing protein [uncultured Desulfovibrio sp.]